MTVAEGGGRRAVSHKLRDMYLPTLKANFMVWPLVQIINFRLMPLQFQLVRFISQRLISTVLIIASAFRVYSRHCVDRIPLVVQRCRGCYGRSVCSPIAQHSIVMRTESDRVEIKVGMMIQRHWDTGVKTNIGPLEAQVVHCGQLRLMCLDVQISQQWRFWIEDLAVLVYGPLQVLQIKYPELFLYQP